MRKVLLVLFGITAMFGFNKVNAAEIKLEYDTNVNQVKSYIEEIGYENINKAINENIKYYNENLSANYSHYFISLHVGNYDNTIEKLYILLTAFDDNYNKDYFARYFDQTFDTSYLLNNCDFMDSKQINYDLNSNSISVVNYGSAYSYNISLFDIDSTYQRYNAYNYYYSNFDLYYRGSVIPNSPTPGTAGYLTYLKPEDTLYFPKYDNSTLYSTVAANTDFLIEPYYLYDNNENLKEENFINIDLNQYSYVALSLKDYSKTETFFTNVYVKGNYCITPVYNYGMTEKSEYYPGYQVDRCSPYYEDFTAVRTYILEQDLKNNAIYYLKAYDKTKDNIVKVDSSIFNITYITEEQKDNPYVSIGGKNYPTISYDNLNSSSTKSEEEGYISGVVCQVGDFNCYSEHNPSNIFQDLFDKPLEMLKSVWGAIISIFTLIGEFIALLPPTMQGFLYISFGIAIILGIIKILL